MIHHLDNLENGIDIQVIEGSLLLDVLDDEHEDGRYYFLGQSDDDLRYLNACFLFKFLCLVLHLDVNTGTQIFGGVECP